MVVLLRFENIHVVFMLLLAISFLLLHVLNVLVLLIKFGLFISNFGYAVLFDFLKSLFVILDQIDFEEVRLLKIEEILNDFFGLLEWDFFVTI